MTRSAMPKDVKAAKERLEATKTSLTKGDTVEVTEPHGKVWVGTVQAVKPSLQSGWWLDVKDAEGLTWTIPAESARAR